MFIVLHLDNKEFFEPVMKTARYDVDRYDDNMIR